MKNKKDINTGFLVHKDQKVCNLCRRVTDNKDLRMYIHKIVDSADVLPGSYWHHCCRWCRKSKILKNAHVRGRKY